jgi:hypothetical protein
MLEFIHCKISRFKKEIIMTQLRFLSDAMAQKRNENDAFEARFAKQNAARAKRVAKFTPRTDLHPAVGVLISAKGVTYYAFVGGVYREGSPEHLASFFTA